MDRKLLMRNRKGISEPKKQGGISEDYPINKNLHKNANVQRILLGIFAVAPCEGSVD